MRKAERLFERLPSLKSELVNTFQRATKKSSHNEIFKSILDIPYFKTQYENCLDENSYRDESKAKIKCIASTVERPIYYAYSIGLLDETATIIFLSKINGGKSASLTGRIGAYSHKIDLLRKSYVSKQGAYREQKASPLSEKNFLKKFGKLKKLSPRQSTLLRYNYTQIKVMGDILIEFDKRANAISSGIYFDFDGDGQVDDTYVMDPADQYRASVKLLKLKLEKESQSGGLFHKNKPSFEDLLVSANELGLISDEDLTAMTELPYLYKEGVPLWKKAANIAWEVGKGVIMAIPGVNLYSIIPIVLVESYIDSKERANETSDLHLITF